jgi:hypothetical protein
MFVALARELPPCEFAQIVVDQGPKCIEGGGIAVSPRAQQASDLAGLLFLFFSHG